MPALDEFLNATAQEQVDLFDSREVQSVEGGVKYANRGLGLTVNGFWTKLKNVVSQGAVVDSVSGATTWVIVPGAETKSYGAEVEATISPLEGLQIVGSTTILKAEVGAGGGTDIGSRLNGVPTSLGIWPSSSRPGAPAFRSRATGTTWQSVRRARASRCRRTVTSTSAPGSPLWAEPGSMWTS